MAGKDAKYAVSLARNLRKTYAVGGEPIRPRQYLDGSGDMTVGLPQDQQQAQANQQGTNFLSAKLADMAANPGRTAVDALVGLVPFAGPINTFSGLVGGPTVGKGVFGSKPAAIPVTPWDGKSPIDLNTSVPGKGAGAVSGTGTGANPADLPAPGATAIGGQAYFNIPAQAFAQYGSVPSLANFTAPGGTPIPEDIVAKSSKVPAPSVTKDQAKEIIGKAFNAVGLPAEYGIAIAQSESGLNNNAKSQYSSAAGFFQITNNYFGKSTQNAWVQFNGKGSPLDPVENARVGAALAGYNAKALKEAGVPVTATNLYVLNYLGTQPGIAALKNPNAPLSQVLPNYKSAVAANKDLAGKTGAWVANKMATDLATRGGFDPAKDPGVEYTGKPISQTPSAPATPASPVAPTGGKDVVEPASVPASPSSAPGGTPSQADAAAATAAQQASQSSGTPSAPASPSQTQSEQTQQQQQEQQQQEQQQQQQQQQQQEQVTDVDVVSQPQSQTTTATLANVPATTVMDPMFNPDNISVLTITPTPSKSEPNTTVAVPVTNQPQEQPNWSKEESEVSKDSVQTNPADTTTPSAPSDTPSGFDPSGVTDSGVGGTLGGTPGGFSESGIGDSGVGGSVGGFGDGPGGFGDSGVGDSGVGGSVGGFGDGPGGFGDSGVGDSGVGGSVGGFGDGPGGFGDSGVGDSGVGGSFGGDGSSGDGGSGSSGDGGSGSGGDGGGGDGGGSEKRGGFIKPRHHYQSGGSPYTLEMDSPESVDWQSSARPVQGGLFQRPTEGRVMAQPMAQAASEQRQEAPAERYGLFAFGTNDYRNPEAALRAAPEIYANAKSMGMTPVFVLPNPNDKRFAPVSNLLRQYAEDKGIRYEIPSYEPKDPLHLTRGAAQDIAKRYPDAFVGGDSNSVRLQNWGYGRKLHDANTYVDPRTGQVLSKVGAPSQSVANWMIQYRKMLESGRYAKGGKTDFVCNYLNEKIAVNRKKRSKAANGGLQLSGDFSSPQYAVMYYEGLPRLGNVGKFVGALMPNPATTGAYDAYMKQYAQSYQPTESSVKTPDFNYTPIQPAQTNEIATLDWDSMAPSQTQDAAGTDSVQEWRSLGSKPEKRNGGSVVKQALMLISTKANRRRGRPD